MSPKHVAVAMSGGVDSSVTAFLLKRGGFRVSGVHLQLRPEPEQITLDLERTCQLLDIPLYQLNFEWEFRELIIGPFLQEYGRGRTPNPCVSCNRHIKFGLLLDGAQQMGADLLATGHYARIESLPKGHRLLKAVDRAKDQSYFLYTLGQQQLPYLLFPLSNYHKTEVRRLAAELGLPASNRHDSQDICFIPGNDYRAFIAQYAPPRPGDIVDVTGNILGQHSGLAGYTIGQRHGLRLSSNSRLYVIRLDTANNRLVVGTEDQLFSRTLVARKLSWVSGEPPEGPQNVTARIRYRSPGAAAQLILHDDMARIDFAEPQRAITPGQSVVFYENETVLGGGIIEETAQPLLSDELLRTGLPLCQ